MKNKKGGLVTNLIGDTSNLVIMVVIALVIVSTVIGAGLFSGDNRFTENSTNFQQVAGNMSSNFTAGIGEVALKIPTILLIAAVVILFGVLVFLVANARRMNTGGGSSL